METGNEPLSSWEHGRTPPRQPRSGRTTTGGGLLEGVDVDEGAERIPPQLPGQPHSDRQTGPGWGAPARDVAPGGGTETPLLVLEI